MQTFEANLKINPSMKKNYPIALLLICCLVGCSDKQPEQFVRSVEVVTPKNMAGDTEKTFSGVVKEAGTINLGFKTPGQIRRIAVDEGDYVRQGQLIASLDDADYKLGVEAAQVQYDQLHDEFQRIERLYRNKSISENDYEKALSGLKQVKIQLQSNQNKLDYTRLYAPTGGYVQAVNFEETEMVDAGTPVVTLMDMSRMEVETDIPFTIYSARDSIKEISCVLPDNGRTENMNIISIIPKADGNQLFKMRLAFSGSNGAALSAGTNVEIRIRLAGNGNLSTKTIPLHALFQEKGKTYVWVVDDKSIARKRQVETGGVTASGEAIVVSGLKGSEQIVKAGVDALHDGEKVNIIKKSATNIGDLL